MLLGVLQALVRTTKGCRITFYARHFELLGSGTHTFEIVPLLKETKPKSGIAITYAAKSKLSVMEQMARQVGIQSLDYSITIPKRALSDLPNGFPRQNITLVIQTVASGWTPNKQWPERHWMDLIDSLPGSVQIVEVGTESIFHEPPRHPQFQSLVGKTSITQYAACIEKASVFIGPVSSAMHLAHAYEVPSVIIIGGYEVQHPYPLAKQFYNDVPCAPCWLRTPCPYEQKCLKEIRPIQVRKAVMDVLPHP